MRVSPFTHKPTNSTPDQRGAAFSRRTTTPAPERYGVWRSMRSRRVRRDSTSLAAAIESDSAIVLGRAQGKGPKATIDYGMWVLPAALKDSEADVNFGVMVSA